MKLRALLLAALLGAPAAALAGERQNNLHPLVTPRDAAGDKTSSPERVSAETTCRGCHDTAYIAAHTGHPTVSCIRCHVEGGALHFEAGRLDDEGRLPRDAAPIGPPRSASCASCHGLAGPAGEPVALPRDFESDPLGRRTWSLTQAEGAVVSPQRMSDSFLGLAGKAALDTPWDVHAAKLLECGSCHHAGNDPALRERGRGALAYVKVDPRRQSLSEFLERPDHRLAEPGCRSCHDALATHDFLPYRERHVEVIACQTCHIPAPMGPVVEMIDGTVVSPAGEPVIHYRNVDRRPGEALNAAVIRPFTPLLVPRVEADGARRLAPVNVVSRYRWVAGPAREPIPASALSRAFLDADGRYAPAIVERFDRDHDGVIADEELRIDDEQKVAVVAARLREQGFTDPTIEGTLTIHPLVHGVSARARALRDCDACHAASSRLDAPFPIAPHRPGGRSPEPEPGARVPLGGATIADDGPGLVLRRDRGAAPAGLHVLGASRHAWSNKVGFFLFVAVALAVSAHGLVRFALRHRHARHAPALTEKVRVFGTYERLWHWTMAISGVVLMVTGFEIHNAGVGWLPGLPHAVLVHNVVAVLFSVNAFLSLFYHLATIAIRSFIPDRRGLLSRILSHIEYQSRGIFEGAPHPEEAPGEKLNPLQQITYLALLNILFPVQIVSGVLIWAVGRFPSFAGAVGGLGFVAPVHNLGAWLFLTFFVLHVYLVTTGRTLGEHLGSMITGYRHVEPEQTR